jgi:hypothetical protein
MFPVVKAERAGGGRWRELYSEVPFIFTSHDMISVIFA